VIVNAGQSPAGRLFGAKHADFSFQTFGSDLAGLKALVEDTRRVAWKEFKREIGILIHAYVVCGETTREALDYERYYVDERGDWEAAEGLIRTLIGAKTEGFPFERLRQMQREMIAGWGSYPLVGTAEQIVAKIQELADIGVDGAGLVWVNFEAGIEQFAKKVVPLMVQAGLRR